MILEKYIQHNIETIYWKLLIFALDTKALIYRIFFSANLKKWSNLIIFAKMPALSEEKNTNAVHGPIRAFILISYFLQYCTPICYKGRSKT